MPGITTSVLMIAALAGTIAMSAVFVTFALRAPTRQGKLTCFVLALMSLLPIAFLVMLIMALQDA